MAQDMVNVVVGDAVDVAVLRLMGCRDAVMRSVARVMGVDLPARREADRLAAMARGATPPPSCGPEIPVAPARGRVLPVQPVAMRAVADGYVADHAGFQGRDAARAGDVFDLMADQARRRGGSAPFTPRQVDAGRRYAAMVERHSSVGLRCVSVEAERTGGGSGGGGYMDAVLAEGAAIRRMEAAAGDGVALAVQRVGGGRAPILVRRLVWMVCVEGNVIDAAMRRHGWTGRGETRERVRAALAGALDRMADAAPPMR